MAYDGYRQSPGPYDQRGNSSQQQPTSPIDSQFASTPPYPSQYAPDRLNMPQPQMPLGSPSQPLNQDSSWYQQPQPQMPPAPPSQPPNPDPSWYQQPQPGRINEAVNSAFYQENNPGYLPPEVVSQITANVIQQLKATGLNNAQGQQPPPQQPSQYQPHPQQPWPPTVPSPMPPYAEPTPAPAQYPPHPPPQFQPPPPQQPWPPVTSSPQPPYVPPAPAQNPGPTQPPDITAGNVEYPSYTGSTGYPPPPNSNPSPVPQPERRESPINHGSDQSHAESRPSAPPRNVTFTDKTTLERIWGKFFDNGMPTERLGQFLRGIAVHLIEDYAPGNTLVIVPEKMQRFYEDTKVPSDTYPWQDIFDDRTSSISRMLREFEVEHHLVQEKFHERPDIPALTPRGFQQWETIMIQAHPEREYKRLQKAVLNMPINNPDDRKERFPKEIPEQLFSEIPNLELREVVEHSIMKHCHVELPEITDEEIANVAERRAQASANSAKHAAESGPSATERGRQPHSTPPPAVVDDNEEESVSPNPIERERQPYSAHPGAGRVYDEARTSSRRHAGSFSKRRPSDGHSHEPPYPRAGGTAAHRFTKGRRSRSSSRVNPYRHSEGDLLDHDGRHRHAGTPPTGEYYFDPAKSSIPGDFADDSRRHRDLDQDAEDMRFQDSLREREREREKSKYHHDHLPHRSSWVDGEDYYRGAR